MSANNAQPIFYTLPADQVIEGMSTDDGQDFLEDVAVPWGGDGKWLGAHVYTPHDDEDQDDENRSGPEYRMYQAGERVALAVFADTDIDGSEWPDAVIGGEEA